MARVVSLGVSASSDFVLVAEIGDASLVYLAQCFARGVIMGLCVQWLELWISAIVCTFAHNNRRSYKFTITCNSPNPLSQRRNRGIPVRRFGGGFLTKKYTFGGSTWSTFWPKRWCATGVWQKVHLFLFYREKVVLFDQKCILPGSPAKFQLWTFQVISWVQTVQVSDKISRGSDVPRLNVGAARKIFLKKIFQIVICWTVFCFLFFFLFFFTIFLKIGQILLSQ